MPALAPSPVRSPEKDARQQRILDNMGLARKVARNWQKKQKKATCNLPYEELLQLAAIGLTRGLDRLEPGKGFSGYLMGCCNGEILHYFRDKHRIIRVQRGLQELGGRLIKARELLAVELKRSPTRKELATYCSCTVQQVEEASLAMSNSMEVKNLDDFQLESRSNPVALSEGGDRLRTIIALIKATGSASLLKMFEIDRSQINSTNLREGATAIDELCNFLIPDQGVIA